MDDMFNNESASSNNETDLDDIFAGDETFDIDTGVNSADNRVSDDEVLRNLGIK